MPEHQSSNSLRTDHIKQLLEIAQYINLNKRHIALSSSKTIMLQDIVPTNPYPYDGFVVTIRYGEIKYSIANASWLSPEVDEILKQIVGVTALLDNDIEDDEDRNRMLARMWRGRTVPSLQIALTSAAEKQLADK